MTEKLLGRQALPKTGPAALRQVRPGIIGFLRLAFVRFKGLLCRGNFHEGAAGSHQVVQQAEADARCGLLAIHLGKSLGGDEAVGQFRADAGEENQFLRVGVVIIDNPTPLTYQLVLLTDHVLGPLLSGKFGRLGYGMGMYSTEGRRVVAWGYRFMIW